MKSGLPSVGRDDKLIGDEAASFEASRKNSHFEAEQDNEEGRNEEEEEDEKEEVTEVVFKNGKTS